MVIAFGWNFWSKKNKKVDDKLGKNFNPADFGKDFQRFSNSMNNNNNV